MSKHSVTLLLVKNGTTWNKPQQPRKGCNVSETIANKWIREKPPPWLATKDIDSYLVILD